MQLVGSRSAIKEKNEINIPKDIPPTIETNDVTRQIPPPYTPNLRHPTGHPDSSWKAAIITFIKEEGCMRRPLPFFALAALALFLTIMYTNYSSTMFSKLTKFKGKVHTSNYPHRSEYPGQQQQPQQPPPISQNWYHQKHTPFFAQAIAWATLGTAQYPNGDVLQKLIHGIDVVYDRFLVGMEADIKWCIQSRKNWWNIQIGAPQNLADLGVILSST
ncbi:uncharacterized protein DFL_003730 [Arthrobotrys flagrans]|uniref:Polysaccharide lyase 8 N-terminal alpha-helical domain-containing protein n=1 Tax=Arthrobotrys flagrans TaxID=97331 RepID=A0A437A2U2_ARTFL|nr:hypothetical protein DFL_003730 [Arthrobotrys flagrans]